MKYILYARKSTEEDDRQVLSIETQLVELQEYAAKEKLEIVIRVAPSPFRIFAGGFPRRLWWQNVFILNSKILLPLYFSPFLIYKYNQKGSNMYAICFSKDATAIRKGFSKQRTFQFK